MATKYVARFLSSTTTTSVLRRTAALRNGRTARVGGYLVKGLLDHGADGKHWIIWVKEPEGNPTRDEIIKNYVNILARALGSEEEARMKIYSVSTRHYYAIGALIDEEICSKLRDMPQVLSINEDTYMDLEKRDYGGEPFIDGRPVPYDRKYHAAYWAMQEGMLYFPTNMDDHKDAEIRATNSASQDKEADYKLSIPRAWFSRVRVWWNGPSP
ncbi:hypothetical protein DCAR_0521031 [Daucus carota subsp. sativus]|nr:hypothetical protein DCAR_0521031 [Daucus carota subsp. sativus]